MSQGLTQGHLGAGRGARGEGPCVAFLNFPHLDLSCQSDSLLQSSCCQIEISTIRVVLRGPHMKHVCGNRPRSARLGTVSSCIRIFEAKIKGERGVHFT